MLLLQSVMLIYTYKHNWQMRTLHEEILAVFAANTKLCVKFSVVSLRVLGNRVLRRLLEHKEGATNRRMEKIAQGGTS